MFPNTQSRRFEVAFEAPDQKLLIKETTDILRKHDINMEELSSGRAGHRSGPHGGPCGSRSGSRPRRWTS